ncbi:MAG: zf-HC2 domain-containing protein [Gemmatimonadota bacterium]|nr:zf-HC2 domain-containing protein [Gemmatimonadota bacterium]
MNDSRCAFVREALPAYVGRSLSPGDEREVSAHLAGCGECRSEMEVVTLLHASRPGAPAGLIDRIQEAVASDGAPSSGRRGVPGWGLAAAAVAVLALGIGRTLGPATPAGEAIPEYASAEGAGNLWLAEERLSTWVPAFDDLSDEALVQLLEELGT